jgi:ankyrin repeat protein
MSVARKLTITLFLVLVCVIVGGRYLTHLNRAAAGRLLIQEAGTAFSAPLVAVLLLLGADANATDSKGDSALLYAAAAGRSYSVQALLLAGADPTRRDIRGTTPLCAATYFANGDLRSMDLLLSRDLHGINSPTAALQCLGESYHREAKAHFLIWKGADPNARDSLGRTPLMRYAMLDYPDVIRLLAGTGLVRVDDRTEAGETALMYAASQVSVGSVRALLDSGADCSIQDNSGRRGIDLARKSCSQTAFSLRQAECADVIRLLDNCNKRE